MPLGNFPIDEYLQASQQGNQNKRNMYQDIQGMGQGIGDIGNSVAQILQQKKQKDLINQIVQSMQNQGQPVQGPQGYVPPGGGQGNNMVPAGQIPPTSNTANQTKALLMKYAMSNPAVAQSVLPSLLKQQTVGKSGLNPYQSASLSERQKEFQQRQKNFQDTMDFKKLLSDLQTAKSEKQRTLLIEKWKGEHPFSAMFGLGPTEGSDVSSASDEELARIAGGQ